MTVQTTPLRGFSTAEFEARYARAQAVMRDHQLDALLLTAPPSNMPGDDTVIEAGMVLTIEPGMEYAPGKMIVHEENVVITPSGAELLTKRAPREMWRID